MKMFNLLSNILRDPQSFIEEIQNSVDLKHKVLYALTASIVLFSIFGLILGANSSIEQAASSAIKLPLLFIMTATICFPTLFIFSALFGDKKSFLQYLAVLLSSLAIIGLLLVAFAPVVIFFMITTDHYVFFKLINIVIFTISGIAGLKYFYKGIQYDKDASAGDQKARANILKSWILLFGFVGSQLAWILRPFFGNPDLPFEMFRNMQGNFYLDLIASITKVFN